MRLVTLADMFRVKKYWLIVRTGVMLLSIRLASHLVSLPRLLTWLTGKPVVGGRTRESMEEVVYYVDRWLAMFPYNSKGNCFPRALALYWFARRVGIPVQFRCGVMKVDRRLEGHAWLMLDGQDFLEPSPYWRSFTVTVAFPCTPLPQTDHPSVLS